MMQLTASGLNRTDVIRRSLIRDVSSLAREEKCCRHNRADRRARSPTINSPSAAIGSADLSSNLIGAGISGTSVTTTLPIGATGTSGSSSSTARHDQSNNAAYQFSERRHQQRRFEL